MMRKFGQLQNEVLTFLFCACVYRVFRNGPAWKYTILLFCSSKAAFWGMLNGQHSSRKARSRFSSCETKEILLFQLALSYFKIWGHDTNQPPHNANNGPTYWGFNASCGSACWHSFPHHETERIVHVSHKSASSIIKIPILSLVSSIHS